MKRSLKLFVSLLICISLLYGCVATGVVLPTDTTNFSNTTEPTYLTNAVGTSDPTIMPTQPQTIVLDYTYSQISYSELNWEKSYILISSFEELTELFDGTLPDYVIHNESFFDHHALIAIHATAPGTPFFVEIGELSQDENGIYHLSYHHYQPFWMRENFGSEYLLLEVNQSIEPGAILVLDSTCEILDNSEFNERFPNPFGNSPIDLSLQ